MMKKILYYWNLLMIFSVMFILGMINEKFFMPDILGTRNAYYMATIYQVNRLLESRMITSYWFDLSDTGDIAMRFKRPSFKKARNRSGEDQERKDKRISTSNVRKLR